MRKRELLLKRADSPALNIPAEQVHDELMRRYGRWQIMVAEPDRYRINYPL